MKDCYKHKEEGVSPVIGVMLMLVVTIIIAAVVSAFAGGLGSDTSKPPVATVVATEMKVNGARDTNTSASWGQGFERPDNDGTAADIYVLFEHKGGDPLNLAYVDVQLSSLQKPNEKSKVSATMTPLNRTTAQAAPLSGDIGDKALITGFSSGWTKYMERWPDHGSIVNTGDKFILHADYATQNSVGVKKVNWLNDGGKYPFWIQQGDVLLYDLMDKNTGKVISSGQIAVPEFTVATT